MQEGHMALVKDDKGRETQPSSSTAKSGGSASNATAIVDFQRSQRESGTISSIGDLRKSEYAGTSASSTRSAKSTVTSTGKSVYDTYAEAELYYRQNGQDADWARDLESDPNYSTDFANYKKERDRKFQLYDSKWQLSGETAQGGQQPGLAEYKDSTDYKVWDIRKNGFGGFDFT